MIELNTRAVLALLRLTGRSRRFRDPARLAAAVQADRRRADGRPPSALTRRFDVSEQRLAGVRCFRMAPRGVRGDAVQLLHLHGGAHCVQMSSQHWWFLARLVEATGCEVHVPLFALAPEADHREVQAQLHATWSALRSQCPGRHWVLMGDSSGGGLALALCQQWVARRDALPDALVLISPWLDLSLSLARQAASTVDDPWLALPGMAAAAHWWAREAAADSAPVSPLFGDLQGLPPATLFIGTRDLLIAECRDLARRARTTGWPLELQEGLGMIHVWPILPLREARAARARIARIITTLSAKETST